MKANNLYALHRICVLIFIFFTLNTVTKAQDLIPVKQPHLKGYWKFQDKSNLTKATVGKDLVLVGKHSVVNGPAYGDTAIRIAIGSYYKCYHNIAPNGGGKEVNRYTLMYDFKVLNFNRWHTFHQTDTTDQNDGECFIRPISAGRPGRIGVGATNYTSDSILANKWYRLMISVNEGGWYRYYLNGVQVLEGDTQVIDDRFALQKYLLLFADDNQEDDTIDVASVAIFDTCLSSADIKKIGTIDPCVVNPASVKLGADTSICAGSSFIKSVPANFKRYRWSTGDTVSSVKFDINKLSTGANSISVKVTTINNCTAADTFVITQWALPPANPGKSTQICAGDIITLGNTANGGNTYSWTSRPSGFSAAISNPSVNPGASTTYYLTETIKATGCFKKDSVTITVNPVPTANTGGNHDICAGTSYNLGTKAVSGHSYNWTSKPVGFKNSTSNPLIKPSATTTYYLIETNGTTGCSKTDSSTITVNPLPTPNAGGNHALCTGNSQALGTTGISGHSYSWASKPAGFISSLGSITVAPKINTTYYLTETITGSGCSQTDSAIINVNPVPDDYTGLDQTICEGAVLSLGKAGIMGNTYSWTSKPAGFSSGKSNPNVNPDITTTYYLTETITSSACSASDSVTIIVNPAPEAYTGPDKSICIGSNITLGKASIAGHSYSWHSLPAGFSASTGDPTVGPLIDTRYYLTETVSATGCSKTDSVVVGLKPVPDARWTATSSSKGIVSFNPDNTNASSYFWHFGDGDSDISISPTHTYHANGVYKIKLTVVNNLGCGSTHDSTITIKTAGVEDINNLTILGLDIQPNPFRSQLRISYTLTTSTQVNVAIYDITGRQVAILCNEIQSGGRHIYQLNLNGSTGMYLLRINLNGNIIERKIIKVE